MSVSIAARARVSVCNVELQHLAGGPRVFDVGRRAQCAVAVGAIVDSDVEAVSGEVRGDRGADALARARHEHAARHGALTRRSQASELFGGRLIDAHYCRRDKAIGFDGAVEGRKSGFAISGSTLIVSSTPAGKCETKLE